MFDGKAKVDIPDIHPYRSDKMLRPGCKTQVLFASLPSLALVALLALTVPARAAGDGFSFVSYSASGSPGAWLLDFTVIPIDKDNMAHLSYIATFGVGPEAGHEYAHPTGYTATESGGATSWHGTKAVSPTFQESYLGGVSGFETSVASATVPEDVSWSVLLNSGSFGADFYHDGGYQSTVLDTGVAHISGVVPGIPEPGTVQLLLAGFAALWLVASPQRRSSM